MNKDNWNMFKMSSFVLIYRRKESHMILEQHDGERVYDESIYIFGEILY